MSSREIIMATAGLGGSVNYWIGTFSAGTYLYGASVDAAGNAYVCGSDYNASPTQSITIKVSALGIQFQRSLTNASDALDGNAVRGGASVYTFNGLYSTPPKLQAVKYQGSGGALEWQRALSPVAAASPSSGTVSSAGYIFLCGGAKHDAGASNNSMYVAAFDYFGALQWQRCLFSGGGTVDSIAYRVDADDSGNAYVFGGNDAGGVQLAKYNSSGVLQWQRSLSPSARYRGCCTPAGDVYSFAYDSGTSTVAKYDTSGTLMWQRAVSNIDARAICADVSGNVYMAGFPASASTGSILVFKYNSSGVLQWQRQLAETSSTPYNLWCEALSANSNTLLIAGGYDGASYGGFSAAIPSDGSLTGTYSVGGLSISYSTSSNTESAGSATSSITTYADYAGSSTSATSTDTDAAASISITKVDL